MDHSPLSLTSFLNNIFYCLFSRPPSGADPGQDHLKYDAVKLQDYEFKITK